MRRTFFKFSVALFIGIALSFNSFSQNTFDVLWGNNFGGSGADYFQSVTAVSDGIIAVGYSESGSFGNGDWQGFTGKGSDDAIIVKYNHSGDVVWRKNFGGKGCDYYNSVTKVPNGTVAVGYSICSFFNTGDCTGIMGQGADDAIIVKYDVLGNIVWKKNFGGIDNDSYIAVTAVSDGIIAVGYSDRYSFSFGDMDSISAKGDRDAIIVKYDFLGNVIWKKNFGGNGRDMYHSVIEVPNGIIAVGVSAYSSFNTGDWEGVMGKGSDDAIMVKYDLHGNVVWKRNFGGNGDDSFNSVTAISDGIVAAGYSVSFGFGDWAGIMSKGNNDAIMVKYDFNGNLVWKKNFGGNQNDCYFSVTAVFDGIVAAGFSASGSFGSGDWTNITGKGYDDAILVKYNHNGDVLWKKNFGGSDNDGYVSVAEIQEGVVVVGFSGVNSFGNGNWAGILKKGVTDAVMVKYDTAGNIVWKRNFGGKLIDNFYSVTAVSGGIVAVGYAEGESFNSGDWTNVSKKGVTDAIMVKYEDNIASSNYVTLYGTLFPFVHTDTLAFDTLFKYTIRLYNVPPPSVCGMDIEEILYNSTPLYTATSTYYDGSVYIPGTPKYPGEIGTVNLVGLPIQWKLYGRDTTLNPANHTVLSGPEDMPVAPVGMYIFENVENNRDYVLRVSRPGYLELFGKITVTGSGSLGHRYIIAGDLDGNLQVQIYDISKINQVSKRVCYPDPNFSAGYDITGDGCVNQDDNDLILYYKNIFIDIYQEAYDWMYGCYW